MRKMILDALKAKFEGVGESVLGRIADKAARTAKSEDDVAALVEGMTIQQVVEAYADSRATEAQQTAVANYERKHGLKDGKKAEPEESDGPEERKSDKADPPSGGKAGAGDEIPAWARPLIERSAALEAELRAVRAEKTEAARKAAFEKAIERAPGAVRARYGKDFGRMSFKDDDDFNAWIGEIGADLDGIAEGYRGGKVVVSRTKGSTGGGAEQGKANPYLLEKLKVQEAEKAAPAIIGLPG